MQPSNLPGDFSRLNRFLSGFALASWVMLAAFWAGNAHAEHVELYPVVTYTHLSDATQVGHNEIGADYIGFGGGIAFARFTVEGTIGQKWLSCYGSKACGRTNGASVAVTWRGKHRQ